MTRMCSSTAPGVRYLFRHFAPLVLAATLSGGVTARGADSPGDATSTTQHGWGRLGSRRDKGGEFYEFTLYQRDKRGHTERKSALLQIPPDVQLRFDRRVPLKDVKKGEELLVFGRPEEFDVDTSKGRGAGYRGNGRGKDRQIQNTQVLLIGEGAVVSESYKDAADTKLAWCRGKATENGAKGVWLDYKKKPHRVVVAKGAPLLRREKPAPKLAAKLLRKGVFLWFEAEPTDATPKKKRRTDTPVLAVRRIVALDRRFLRTAYRPIID